MIAITTASIATTATASRKVDGVESSRILKNECERPWFHPLLATPKPKRMQDPECKEIMRDIAKAYEKFADFARRGDPKR
jgi:hypothetical protein